MRGNRIEGRLDQRMNDRGNGVYVWNAQGAVVEGNDIRYGRDGIFVNSSKKNTFTGNLFRDLRFAVHYMYADDSVVSDNVSIGNDLGYAVMFTTNVTVANNVSIGDREHGVMLNYANKSTITGQRGERREREMHSSCITRTRTSSPITGSRDAASASTFTAGSERNRIVGNAFIGKPDAGEIRLDQMGRVVRRWARQLLV